MKEKIEKYQIFVYLVMVILILSVLKIRFSNKENFEEVIKPTPTQIVNDDYPLENKLPYKGNGFVVEKYIAPKTLRMILTGASEEKATAEVTVWINSFGDVIGQHKIELEEASPTAKTKPTLPSGTLP